MLYTCKGDDGKTKMFACDQRISKSSAVAEALGSLDEINSYLGLCKIKSAGKKLKLGKRKVSDIAHKIQENLFIIQAEVAGAPKTVAPEKVLEMEKIIAEIEKELPPIKTFFISGGDELSSLFDFARTIARRAERRVIAVADKGKINPASVHQNGLRHGAVSKSTLSYLNRLSSILYALARYSNHKAGIVEEAPKYK